VITTYEDLILCALDRVFRLEEREANEKRSNFYAQSTVSLATALNPYIGYAKAAEIAKEAVATGRSIIEIARAKKLLSEKEINEILDPVRMTEPVRPLESAAKREQVKSKS